MFNRQYTKPKGYNIKATKNKKPYIKYDKLKRQQSDTSEEVVDEIKPYVPGVW
jgi:hypothetical protein